MTHFGKLCVDIQEKARRSLHGSQGARGYMGLPSKLFEPAWMTRVNYKAKNGALGSYAEGPRYNDWVKRCSKCGLEGEGSSILGW